MDDWIKKEIAGRMIIETADVTMKQRPTKNKLVRFGSEVVKKTWMTLQHEFEILHVF